MEKKQELVEKQPEEINSIITLDEMKEIEAEKKVDWDELLKYLEVQKEAFKRLRIIMLGYTRPSDWVNLDGTPYLQESGAQAIAGPMGVSLVNISREKEWREDKKGRYFIWIYKGTAYSNKIQRIIEAEGICSSRDKFFGKVGGVFKEVEDVEERNIMEKARTNLYRNGIIRVLGLRNLQWGELSAAGLKIEEIPKVEHTLHGKKTGIAEKAIQNQAEKEKAGDRAGGYPAIIVQKAGKMAEKLSTAPSMDKLREVWIADQDERKKLPKELFDQLTKLKDDRKRWLIEREQKEKEEI